MDDEVEKLASQLLECMEEDGSVSGISDIQKYSTTIFILAEKIINSPPFSYSDVKISKLRLESELKKIIKESKKKENEFENFKDKFDDLKNKFGRKDNEDLSKFSIIFPLNLKFKGDNKPDKYTICDKEIKSIKWKEWEENYKKEVEGNEDFEEFMDRCPEELEKREFEEVVLPEKQDDVPIENVYLTKYSFWKIDLNAYDREYAMNQAEYLLEILLGKINFSVNVGTETLISYSKNVNPSGLSDLKKPFVYFVFKNQNFQGLYQANDYLIRNKFRITGNNKKRYDNNFKELPNFSSNNSEIDHEIIKALRFYQRAITEYDLVESFFDFWRGVETLTLTNEDDSMEDVVRRATFTQFRPKIIENRLERICNKRNDYVHNSIDVEITESDRDFARSLFEGLFYFLINNKDEFDLSELRNILDKGTKKEENGDFRRKDLDDLQRLKNEIERDIEKSKSDRDLVQDMINWEKEDNN